MNRFLSVKKNC